MKDGTRTEPPLVSRQDLYQHYASYYAGGLEEKPCSYAALLEKAAKFLLGAPEPTETYTVFPFHRVLLEAPDKDCSKHLRALSKATEVLETLCLNLYLQPWKKEFKTLKTFTGPFVYFLLPALSSSTIQSVLASIGYLPHPDYPESQYALSEDTNPDRAMLVGFELLLARVECSHLLELVEQDKPGPQEWLEILQRRAAPVQMEEPEEKNTAGQKEEAEEEKRKEEAGQKEVPLSLEAKSAAIPKLRSQHRLSNEDKFFIEMQRTYTDLAIRGRPLLQHGAHQAGSSRSSNKAAYIDKETGDIKAGNISNIIKSKAARRGKSDHRKPDEVFGEDGRNSRSACSRSAACNESAGDGTSNNGDNSNGNNGGIRSGDGDRAEDGMCSGPQAMSLRITLRAGTKSEPGVRPGEAQATETSTRTEQQAAADVRNVGLANAEAVSLSSVEEEEDLRELAEKMGQLQVYKPREEKRKKSENKRENETKNKKRKEREREASEKEGEATAGSLQNPRKQVEAKNTSQSHVTASHGVRRSEASSQLETGAMRGEQPNATNFKAGADETEPEVWRDTDLERAVKEREEEERLLRRHVKVKCHEV